MFGVALCSVLQSNNYWMCSGAFGCWKIYLYSTRFVMVATRSHHVCLVVSIKQWSNVKQQTQLEAKGTHAYFQAAIAAPVFVCRTSSASYEICAWTTMVSATWTNTCNYVSPPSSCHVVCVSFMANAFLVINLLGGHYGYTHNLHYSNTLVTNIDCQASASQGQQRARVRD